MLAKGRMVGKEVVEGGTRGAEEREKGTYRIYIPALFWIIGLPATGRKNVFVAFIPASKHNLSSM